MENNNLPAPHRPCLERAKEFIRRHWTPTPIDPPKPDPKVDALTGAQRSAEVVRYSILSLEFWLSPMGKLREWVRLNSKLSAVLLIPAVLILPLITYILAQVAGWLVILVSISGHLIILPLMAVLAVVAIVATISLLRAIFGK
jgi:hypothetical protein